MSEIQNKGLVINLCCITHFSHHVINSSPRVSDLFFSPPPPLPLNARIRDYWAHTWVDRAWEQRGGVLVSVVLVYLLVFCWRTWKPQVSNELELCPSAGIVIFEQQSLEHALLQTCKEWLGSFCFSPWQHVQMVAYHWAAVLQPLLRNLSDLKPVVPHDWKSVVEPFAIVITMSLWGFNKKKIVSWIIVSGLEKAQRNQKW